MKRVLIIASIFAGVISICAADFIVQVEKFPETTKNTKTIFANSALGKRYLLFKEKDATATAKVIIPEAGGYWIYVRDLSMNGQWRNGCICINKKKIDAKIGDAHTPDGRGQVWMWTKLPRKIDLPAGEIEIKIISNSSRTRYDAIYFTTESNDISSVNMKEVNEMVPDGYVQTGEDEDLPVN